MKNLFVCLEREECSYLCTMLTPFIVPFIFYLFQALPNNISFFLFSRLLSRFRAAFISCVFAPPRAPLSFLILRSSDRFPILRCIWANDRDCEPGEPPVPADLWCGQAAGLHSRDRSCLLDHPHGLQHLVVQTPEEEERPLQQLCRHTQRSVYRYNDTPWMLPCLGYPLDCLIHSSGLRFEDIFLTHKLWRDMQFISVSSQILPTHLTSCPSLTDRCLCRALQVTSSWKYSPVEHLKTPCELPLRVLRDDILYVSFILLSRWFLSECFH